MGKQLNVENSVISAKDDALFYNAMLQKNGVWQYGNKLDYEIISANQINIKDGMLTAQGRNYVIYPNEVDSLTIENGTVNTKRNDLIVYEVSKTSEGEQVGLKVIKGTVATTPTDPILIQENTLVSGSKYQMPLYRVRLNGINIEGVDDLREYIVSFGNLSNDNLLINSFFQNYIINQRGLASYSADTTNKYTIDRWYAFNVYVDVNNDEGLLGLKTSGEGMLRQIFENPLSSNVYTVSISVPRVVSGTLKIYCQGYEDDVLVIDSVGIYTYTFAEKKISRFILHTVNFEGSISWMKLEPGSIATPLVPRPYGEELALCQRYCQKIECLGICNNFESGTWYMIGVPFTTSMRINPTIESYSVLDTGFGSANVSISDSYIDTDGVYKIILDSIGEKSMYFFKLLLSAEIY